MSKNQKYIFVTGGVLSGVGKGITAASIGAILQAKGIKVSIQKCDPYLNVDAGLLSPKEHGECFVTKDGAETDLDLGHYERFLDIELTERNTTLSGKLFRQLIDDERAGKFGGQTVQMVPHLTSAIQDSIEAAAEGSDVHIVEIGGTVGDYEALSFIEAIREFALRVGRENCLYTHVVYVPFIGASKEFKTKPAQNALGDLRGFGIVPDSVVVRTDEPAPGSIGDKISQFSGVSRDSVVMLPNASTVFQVPLTIAASGINDVLTKFTEVDIEPDLTRWSQVVEKQLSKPSRTLKIGLVVKYPNNEDAYLSVVEALNAAAWAEEVGVDIKWIDSEVAEDTDFMEVDGLVVPSGFGAQGVSGKVAAARFALETNKPYLGVSLGLQIAAIAGARKAGLVDATSTEFEPESSTDVVSKGLLRLGDHTATLKDGSLAAELYGKTEVTERHRHSYRVNKKFINSIEKGGLVVSGSSQDGETIEFIEAPDHPYFIATQSHPEFRSRPHRPHPLFVGLIRASVGE